LLSRIEQFTHGWASNFGNSGDFGNTGNLQSRAAQKPPRHKPSS
jgi:hypothetical protein